MSAIYDIQEYIFNLENAIQNNKQLIYNLLIVKLVLINVFSIY